MKNLLLLFAALCCSLPAIAQWTDNGANITTSDKVGIGTSSPQTNLEVRHGQSGGIIVKRANMPATKGKGLYLTGGGYKSDPDWGGISAGVWHDLGTYTARSNAASAMEFKNGTIYFKTVDGLTDGTFKISFPSRLTIKPNGNVGIGTNNPLSKLAVAGTIRATAVKVQANISVPDYVFEEDYQLPSLRSIAAYIEQHKHLPEIPSAAEIEENGIDLGRMNLLLLKKIEELTLHTIQQQQEIEQLKKLFRP